MKKAPERCLERKPKAGKKSRYITANRGSAVELSTCQFIFADGISPGNVSLRLINGKGFSSDVNPMEKQVQTRKAHAADAESK